MADYFESYLSMEPHILIRFGKWKDAIDLPLPEDQSLYCSLTALVHYARALGHAALKDVSSAKQEEQAGVCITIRLSICWPSPNLC